MGPKSKIQADSKTDSKIDRGESKFLKWNEKNYGFAELWTGSDKTDGSNEIDGSNGIDGSEEIDWWVWWKWLMGLMNLIDGSDEI